MIVSDNNILVTVVIPAYNHEAYIAKCIESVLSQGIQDLELIVIDDASADNTAAIAEKYTSDARVTLIVNEENLGSFGNNSKAIRVGQGKYFVWLHGDDYLLPGHLADALVRLEENPHCDLAYSPCYWVDEQDHIIKLLQHPGHCLHHYAGGRNEVAELLAYDNYITPSSAVMRRSALDKFTGFDINIRAGDWYLFVQLALNNPNFIFINRASTCYRIHDGQFSNEFYQSDKPLRAHIGIIENVLINGQANKLLPLYTQIQEHLINRISGYAENTVRASMDRLKLIQNTMKKSHDDSICKVLSDEPLVTVVIETRDNPIELHDTVTSLVKQTYQNWEAIIVNNSGYNVSGLLDRFNLEDQIHYIELDYESSYSTAVNSGLRFAKGDIIAYLNAGESWSIEHLEQVVKSMHENNKHAVYTDSAEIEEINQSKSITMSSVVHSIELLGMVRMADEGSRSNDTHGFVQRLAANIDMYHLKKMAVGRAGLQSLFSSAVKQCNDDESQATIVNTPLVSIVVPTYNRPQLLKNALESIKDQVYENWEVVVVDDGDGSGKAVVAEFDINGQFRYFMHEKNMGQSAARNTALRQAKGDIICFLDDDDIIYPDHLETLVSGLNNFDGGVVYTDSIHTERQYKDDTIVYRNIGNLYSHQEYSRERLYVGNYIPINTIAFMRSYLEKTGLFDEELSSLEDWDLLLRLSKVSNFCHIHKTTAEIRLDEQDLNNVSDQGARNYPIVYREIYERNRDLDNDFVQSQRILTIKHIDEVFQGLMT